MKKIIHQIRQSRLESPVAQAAIHSLIQECNFEHILRLMHEGKVSLKITDPKGEFHLTPSTRNYDQLKKDINEGTRKIVGYKVLEKSETIRETDDSKDITNSKDAINLARNKVEAFIKALGKFSGKREETRFVNSFIKENEELSTEIMSEIALSLNDFFVQGLGSKLSVAVLNTGEKPTFVSGQEVFEINAKQWL